MPRLPQRMHKGFGDDEVSPAGEQRMRCRDRDASQYVTRALTATRVPRLVVPILSGCTRPMIIAAPCYLSSDGSRIVFRSMRDGNAEIYLMNQDGTHPRRLTDDPATDTMPSLLVKRQPGRLHVVTRRRLGDYILELNDDGSPGQLERLTHSPGRDMHARFSPDDEWVIFTSERGGLNDELPLMRVVFQPQPYGEIHAIRLADRHVVRLTHNK